MNRPLKIPVLLLIFNRIDTTKQVLDSIRRVKPQKLYVAADGPRDGVAGEKEMVNAVRNYVMQNIDWDCEIVTLFRRKNLGGKYAPIDAITWFFEHERMGIILEDDCVATTEFFRFCEWGLEKYDNEQKIGMITGSNLVDYAYNARYRNGFSIYFNPWGWASWSDRWQNYDACLSFGDITELDIKLKGEGLLTVWERLFWKNVFKHTVGFSTTWDFYLQFLFFRRGLFSVYPTKNLIMNIGFGSNATRTKSPPPYYWRKSLPPNDVDVMSLPVCEEIIANADRDGLYAKTIWNCTPLTAIRLTFTNLFRYMRV